jgi:hypothetical protein
MNDCKALIGGAGMIPFAKPGQSEQYDPMGHKVARLALADFDALCDSLVDVDLPVALRFAYRSFESRPRRRTIRSRLRNPAQSEFQLDEN